ncbi:hypothetical protein L2750_17465 [Shewanella submarina]|uniref:RNA polymerase sigma factor n=1 Tax=Shewanella submarina TaxID=2016376 RepID=A0ABV7GG13_9GAMM|nr:hypothetical protein [Shewanella submarina]
MTENPSSNGSVVGLLEHLIRADRGRMLATMMAQFGNLGLCEEALQDAKAQALLTWQQQVPAKPAAWLLQVARRKAIDVLRREQHFQGISAQLSYMAETDVTDADLTSVTGLDRLPDQRLKLIFICCHPALEEKSRVALTLKLIAGLSTEEIARAFLDKSATLGQRLSRARRKFRQSGIRYGLPGPEDWPARLASVLQVIYLIFNEGYACSSGEQQLRLDLCEEAIFLGELMGQLCPNEAEVLGLNCLMALTHARRHSRQSDDGIYIPLAEQDRSQWDRQVIADSSNRLEQVLALKKPGPFQLQAAIAALHGEATDFESTDWQQICVLYRLLLSCQANDVIRLNLALAISWVEGPQAGLDALASLTHSLAGYQPFHAARADLLRRLHHSDVTRSPSLRGEAIKAYNQALALTQVESERAFLTARRDSLL